MSKPNKTAGKGTGSTGNPSNPSSSLKGATADTVPASPMPGARAGSSERGAAFLGSEPDAKKGATTDELPDSEGG